MEKVPVSHSPPTSLAAEAFGEGGKARATGTRPRTMTPTTNDEWPTTNSQRPTTNDRRLTSTPPCVDHSLDLLRLDLDDDEALVIPAGILRQPVHLAVQAHDAERQHVGGAVLVARQHVHCHLERLERRAVAEEPSRAERNGAVVSADFPVRADALDVVDARLAAERVRRFDFRFSLLAYFFPNGMAETARRLALGAVERLGQNRLHRRQLRAQRPNDLDAFDILRRRNRQ